MTFLRNQSIKYGLGAGLGFALASLWIREASLSLQVSLIYSASVVLCYMVALQALLCLLWVAWQDRTQLGLIASNLSRSFLYRFYWRSGISGLVYRNEPAGGSFGQNAWAIGVCGIAADYLPLFWREDQREGISWYWPRGLQHSTAALGNLAGGRERIGL